MHSFTGPSGRTYLHNGDFSGEVRAETDQFYTSTTAEIAIPFEDIRALYFQYMRSRLIARLEEASDDDMEAQLLR